MKKSTNTPTPILEDADAPGLLGASEVARLIGLDAGSEKLVPLIVPGSFQLAGRLVWFRSEVAAWLVDHKARWSLRELGDWLLLMADYAGESPRLADRSTGPRPCQPWCRNGAGESAPFVEDQRCYSEALRVDLTLHPDIPDSILEDDEYRPGPDYVSVYAVHQPHTEATEIVVQRGDGHEVRYTRDEAGQLVEALQLLLGQTA